MLKQAAYFLASVIILMAIFVAIERVASPSFQRCINEHQEPNAESSVKEYPSRFDIPFIFSRTTAYVRCSGRFIEGHGVGITAIATIVIGAFTCTLWLATTQQARLTEASIRIAERALTELEAPFVFVQINSPGLTVEGSQTHFGMLQWCVVNYGRTPASILETFHEIPSVERDHDPPAVDPTQRRGHQLPYGVIAPPNGGRSHDFPAIPVPNRPFSTHSPFFLGFVRYADIFQNRFILGFCFLFDAGSNTWIRALGDEYNYCRKE